MAKDYNFRDIENRWQKAWVDNQTYKVEINSDKPKFYVLDMFPYPSGAGLHVGHPLGYIASDIYARFKRLNGFNVLHPMGYDAYGLPAEQYAIQTGQHPAITTSDNINRYRRQLDKIGFCFDWSREVRTCDPGFYKWTQWAFEKMFVSFYDKKLNKARPIEMLVNHLQKHGTQGLDAAQSKELDFTADEWNNMSSDEKLNTLMNYRIAYLGNMMVNWCPKLGTVLANDEVVEGLSVRGGYPVVQKVMKQWCLRVSSYAQRLLDGLDTVDWSDSIKETQRNWIGRSEGAEMKFQIKDSDVVLTIFTTRADTVFGVTFMVLAPESPYTLQVAASEQRAAVEEYVDKTRKRTERERIADRKVTGVFTGAYAINPLTLEEIPVYVSDYVLSGYGTGAIMAVPAHDSRDYAFAKEFDLEIRTVVEGADVSQESFDAKEGIVCNSPMPGKTAVGGLCLNGLTIKQSITVAKKFISEQNIGRVKVNYRLRDAIFSRQRYWGEPFPVYYKDGQPYMLPAENLPLLLPEIDKYLPTETGEPPLGRARNWQTPEGYPFELCTMPGFAGSSAYYLRYMDPHNDDALVSPEANSYWKNVDLYVGGSEHATGHLIYSRFWNKFLFDIGVSSVEEPFKKLVNQGMIQGRSNFVYRVKDTNTFVSFGLKDNYDVTPIHVDVNIVSADVLDIEAFKQWRPEFASAEFILEDGRYVCGWAVEKMSKSMFNVVNPDMIVEKFGADTLRMYEMFLGPIELSKPWDTNGIDGVHRFLRKLWRHFIPADTIVVSDEEPTAAEYKVLHTAIKKISDAVERFSFNTCVSQFMITLSELQSLKCNKRQVLEPLVILLAPFAPHICEELWSMLGYESTVFDALWPEFDESKLVEDELTYPVAFNGKTRFNMVLPANADAAAVENAVRNSEQAAKYIDGKTVKKVIVVPSRMINIVIV